jgi:hypothetical protein
MTLASFSGIGKKWWILIFTIIIGSLAGMYLRHFPIIRPYLGDFFSPGFNIADLDLAFADFSMKFYFHCNLGTLIGGILGIWIII